MNYLKNKIRKYINRLHLAQLGINPYKFFKAIKGIPYFIKNYFKFKKQAAKSDMEFKFGSFYPCLSDRFLSAGKMSGHYFHQDLFVAQKIFEANPKKHLDIGSRIDGFVAHIASFRKIEVLDIRTIENKSDNNIYFKAVDFMSDINLVDYCDSISALHSFEHFGLGRYGDTVDYYGYLKALENVNKILKKGGTFYFSVPIGPQRVEFDAHRVFSLKYITALFDKKFKIKTFSYVDDNEELFPNISLTKRNINNNCDCKYGLGIFELEK